VFSAVKLKRMNLYCVSATMLVAFLARMRRPILALKACLIKKTREAELKELPLHDGVLQNIHLRLIVGRCNRGPSKNPPMKSNQRKLDRGLINDSKPNPVTAARLNGLPGCPQSPTGPIAWLRRHPSDHKT